MTVCMWQMPHKFSIGVIATRTGITQIPSRACCKYYFSDVFLLSLSFEQDTAMTATVSNFLNKVPFPTHPRLSSSKSSDEQRWNVPPVYFHVNTWVPSDRILLLHTCPSGSWHKGHSHTGRSWRHWGAAASHGNSTNGSPILPPADGFHPLFHPVASRSAFLILTYFSREAKETLSTYRNYPDASLRVLISSLCYLHHSNAVGWITLLYVELSQQMGDFIMYVLISYLIALMRPERIYIW